MGNPQTFDIIVGVIFSFFLAAGIGFGVRKMLLIFLTFIAPVPLTLLVLEVVRHLDAHLPAMSVGVIGLCLTILSLVLVLVIMFRMRGAGSAASRVFGAALAAAWATLLVATVALRISMTSDMHEVRSSSITGPAVFAVGDTLMSLLPDNPDSMFKKRERPTI